MRGAYCTDLWTVGQIQTIPRGRADVPAMLNMTYRFVTVRSSRWLGVETSTSGSAACASGWISAC
eukprot:3709341-Prymnesium_polylepis.1